MRKLKSIFLLFIVTLFIPLLLWASEIWYEDNNLKQPGGYPPDFVEKFYKIETWQNALNCIDVYMIRMEVLRQMDDNFLKNLKIFLIKYKKRLALDAEGATWTQANLNIQMKKEQELELLKKLKQYNIYPCCILFQSVLSKDFKNNKGEIIEYPLENRIEDIINYIKSAKQIFSDIKFGIIDALPTKGRDYQSAYVALLRALKKEGYSLDYILLDAPFDYMEKRISTMSWEKLKEIENFVKNNLKLKFGIFVTSKKGGETSALNFYKDVLTYFDRYQGITGNPDFYTIGAWFTYPDKTIPESCDNNYPAMCVVLDFCEKAKYKEKIKQRNSIKQINRKDIIYNLN
jgi:hypothetical protein